MEEIKKLIDETFLKGEEYGVKNYKLTRKENDIAAARVFLKEAEQAFDLGNFERANTAIRLAEGYIKMCT